MGTGRRQQGERLIAVVAYPGVTLLEVVGTVSMLKGLAMGARLKNERRARQTQVMAEYDPQPPFGGIAWREVDREALTPICRRACRRESRGIQPRRAGGRPPRPPPDRASRRRARSRRAGRGAAAREPGRQATSARACRCQRRRGARSRPYPARDVSRSAAHGQREARDGNAMVRGESSWSSS